MTATIDFLTGSAKDVLLVPNAALRFRPTEQMREQVRKRAASQGEGDAASRGSWNQQGQQPGEGGRESKRRRRRVPQCCGRGAPAQRGDALVSR